MFTPNRKIWVFKQKVSDSRRTGDVFDENGKQIGSIHWVIIDLGGKIELRELDGSVACVVHQKNVAIQQIYDVKDAKGKMLGRIKKANTSSLKRKLCFETEDGQKLFEVEGKLMRWNFVILDVSGREVANINRFDKWNFIKGMSNLKDKYALQIKDEALGKVDARQLLGFVLAIDNIFHD